MKIYLVGGAVRDQLLGRNVIERDYVVVGATPQDMLALGYTPVGKDFPVFLHPQTNEEYALARTERKTSAGYTGFECHADPSVTLEEDLLRRDLTINAIAQTDSGELIDPFNGQADIAAKIFRHVSPAFSEDPVRILRLGRFAARLPDFTVAGETIRLAKQMVEDGEVDALVAERVWKELSRALTETAPIRFFEILQDCSAMSALFPEIEQHAQGLTCLKQLPQTIANILLTADTANSAMQTLKPKLEILTDPHRRAKIAFAVLLSACSEDSLKKLRKRLRPPTEFSDLALHVIKFQFFFRSLQLDNAESIISLLERLDAYRRPERFENFLLASYIIENDPSNVKKVESLLDNLALSRNIDTSPLLEQGLEGKAIGEALHQLRVQAVKKAC